MHKITSEKANNRQKSKDFLPPTLFNLTEFNHKKVEVRFNVEQISTDGGLLLLNEVDKQIGLIDRLSGCINDARHQGYVKHTTDTMLRQRIMQIAAGYEDCNDCNTLRNDGILKIGSGREQSLATQPTMSRFENQLSNKELYNIAKAFVDQFIASYPDQPEIIILDCDDTNAFTPDGDGRNDVFMAFPNDNDISHFSMQVFDRWGGRIFESDDISIGWDGTKNGKPFPVGVYVYRLTFRVDGVSEEQVVSGTVALVR